MRRHFVQTPPVFTANGTPHSSHSVLKIDFWKIGTARGGRGTWGNLGDVVPAHDVSHPDRPSLDDLAERSAAPIGKHLGAQPGQRLVHALARLGLTADGDPAVANAQDAPARSRELAPLQHDVGPTTRRVERRDARRYPPDRVTLTKPCPKREAAGNLRQRRRRVDQ